MDSLDMIHFKLYITFAKGDHRAAFGYKPKSWLPMKGGNSLLITYVSSLETRVKRLHIIMDKINDANTDTATEMIEITKTGFGSSSKMLELSLFYEMLLYEIYSIMENIAIINIFMFEDNYNVSRKFTDQRKKIIKGDLSFHLKYDEMIKNETDWYMEVNTIRNNITHFMAGIIVFSRDDDGNYISEHLSYNVSGRKEHNRFDSEIKKQIIESSLSYFEKTMNFLDATAEIYIEIMDKDTECAIPFMMNNKIEFRIISYNNYVELLSNNNGESGMTYTLK